MCASNFFFPLNIEEEKTCGLRACLFIIERSKSERKKKFFLFITVRRKKKGRKCGLRACLFIIERSKSVRAKKFFLFITERTKKEGRKMWVYRASDLAFFDCVEEARGDSCGHCISQFMLDVFSLHLVISISSGLHLSLFHSPSSLLT